MAPGLLDPRPQLSQQSIANGNEVPSKVQQSPTAESPGLNGDHDLVSQVEDKTQTTQPPLANEIDAAISALCHRLSQKYANPSLHVTPAHTLSLQPTPIPHPSPTQVLLHIRATGICGSDLHLWHRGAIGPLIVDRPCILGHEAAGVVLAVGSTVNHLRPGDRVAVEPGVPCGSCWLCTAGRYNLCESVQFAGVCPAPGTVRRFAAHEARFCHRLLDGMTFAQGALLEPLSVVLHALSRCKGVGVGRPMLICGAGPIGLIALKAARASGAWPLVVTDVEEQRLEFASRFVPGTLTYRVDAARKLGPERCADEIKSLFCVGPRDTEALGVAEEEYKAPATVLECTGVESSVATAAYCCRRGGEVMVVGVGKSMLNNLPFMHLSLAEVSFDVSLSLPQLRPAIFSTVSCPLTSCINTDRPKIHQPLPRYLARWHQRTGRQTSARPRRPRHAYLPTATVARGDGVLRKQREWLYKGAYRG